MRSTSGSHFVGLDHVRALAAFLVFSWHFLHAANGYPVPFEGAPRVFPFALLDEGHTGVALFMSLSGYLFAKLLDGKPICYRAFLYNRALRLLPLLTVVVAAVGFRLWLAGAPLAPYLLDVVRSPLFGSLPNGGWSVVVEVHFYLLLPVFLRLIEKSKLLPVSIVFVALALRTAVYTHQGSVQFLAYSTILGRVDQFALGMLAFHFRHLLTRRHLRIGLLAGGFALFYWYFDRLGGFYQFPSYPSPSPLWIAMPSIEGVAYASLIAWYDASFSHRVDGISRFVGRIGEYSYSIYLFHFFFVFEAARFIHRHIMPISNFYLACLWSVPCFLLLVPLGYLSFRFIEAPFLGRRKPYLITRRQSTGLSS